MRGVVWFLVLSFGLAWIPWEIVIRSGVAVTSWNFQLYVIPGAFAPALACFIVRKWITREGFADAGLRLNASRWPYYLIAYLIPLAVVAAITLEAMLLGLGQPDFTLASAAETGAAGRDARSLAELGPLIVPQVMLMALLFVPLLWGEEFGWRSYLQIRIFEGRPVAAAVATGFIWAIWHFPLTLRGYNYPDEPVLGSLLFIPFCIIASYIFGWIRERSGSIWAASLAHSATNSIGGLVILWFAAADRPFVISYAGLLAVPPLLIVCIAIWRFSDRPRLARAK